MVMLGRQVNNVIQGLVILVSWLPLDVMDNHVAEKQRWEEARYLLHVLVVVRISAKRFSTVFRGTVSL
jgi:hypothetical protein